MTTTSSSALLCSASDTSLNSSVSSTWSFFVSKPTYEKVTYFDLAGMVKVYEPSPLVIVPAVVPST
jgi:hypothetical protein